MFQVISQGGQFSIPLALQEVQNVSRNQRSQAVRHNHHRTVERFATVILLLGNVTQQRDVAFRDAGARGSVEWGSPQIVVHVEDDDERCSAVVVNDGGND